MLCLVIRVLNADISLVTICNVYAKVILTYTSTLNVLIFITLRFDIAIMCIGVVSSTTRSC